MISEQIDPHHDVHFNGSTRFMKSPFLFINNIVDEASVSFKAVTM